MRFAILLFAVALPLAAQTNYGSGSFRGTQDFLLSLLKIPKATVATLPTASTSTDVVYRVTDAATAGSCVTGGGSAEALCVSNGTAWVALGDGGTGGSGTDPTVNGFQDWQTSAWVNRVLTSGTFVTVSNGGGGGNPTFDLDTTAVNAEYARKTAVNTFSAGARQTFQQSATVAGLRIICDATAPSTFEIGDIYCDADAKVYIRTTTAWTQVGGSGSGDFSSNTATSVDNEVVLFSGTSGKTGKRATTTGIAKLTSGVLSAATAGTDYSHPSTAETRTNFTMNAEGTGNVITIPTKVYLEAAACQNTTAALMWDHQGTGMPAAACFGTNRVKGVADFDAAADEAMHRYFALPADFTGAVDVRVFWFAAATTGTARMGVRIDCFAGGEGHDGAVTNSTTFAGTPNGTTNLLVITSQTGITTTGCAASELARVDFFRDGDGTSGTDDMAGDLRLIGIELTMRRAM